MSKGKIILQRTHNIYTSGFGIVTGDLNNLEAHLSSLSPKEREYYHSLIANRRKITYLLGRIAARKALSTIVLDDDVTSYTIETGIFSFPIVKGVSNQNLQVSISHSDTIGVALAYPEAHPMGIDLEPVNVEKVEVMNVVINPNEWSLLSAMDLSRAVYGTILWTVKESLSKIFRTGLTMDLRLLEVGSITKQHSFYLSTFKNIGQYKSISFCIGAYVCTITLPKNTTPDLAEFEQSLQQVVSLG